MKSQIVSFHCVMKNVLGQVLSTSFNRDVITQIHGENPGELPGLTAGLEALRSGEHREIHVPAGEAYGLYNPRLARQATRKSLRSNGDLAVGDRVHLLDDEGEYRLYRVTRIEGDLIALDANHPLAGQDLIFEVDVLEARDATPDEVTESSAPTLPPHLH